MKTKHITKQTFNLTLTRPINTGRKVHSAYKYGLRFFSWIGNSSMDTLANSEDPEEMP